VITYETELGVIGPVTVYILAAPPEHDAIVVNVSAPSAIDPFGVIVLFAAL
jgi:hypothetical protein